MSADDGRVNQQIFHVAVGREMLEQRFKDAEVTPSGEAFINGVPVAILFGQESPLCTRTSDPQDSFEKTAH